MSRDDNPDEFADERVTPLLAIALALAALACVASVVLLVLGPG